MKNLNGWQVVALVGILCATLVTLVWQGQSVGAIVAAGVVVASALGVNVATSFAQNSVNSEKLGQVKDLANGQNQALQRQLVDKDKMYTDLLAEKDRQLQAAHDRAVQLAAMIPPDKAMESSATQPVGTQLPMGATQQLPTYQQGSYLG